MQGPEVKPHELTGEERFFMKKMAQKKSNYVPIGRRGVFGGVILNMHMHWKKHETVKVICNSSCKPGQVQEFAQEIARLSGGIPIQIIGDDTVIFYRGKNYVQPKVMSPVDTLSKKKVRTTASIIIYCLKFPLSGCLWCLGRLFLNCQCNSKVVL
jgi:RNA-binding protein YhbY